MNSTIVTTNEQGRWARAKKRALGLTRDFDYSVDVVDETWDELESHALANFNEWHPEDQSDVVTDGMVLAYLRHKRTAYDLHIFDIQRRQGAVPWKDAQEMAYEILLTRHLHEIASVYPNLSGTCASLLRRRFTPFGC